MTTTSARAPRGRGRASPNNNAGAPVGEPKEYIAFIYNLPIYLDRTSCQRNQDSNWKPLKDLMRKVINKGDDGTDIKPQQADPKTVKIQCDTDRSRGCGVCTLKREEHARRALRWLGGNTWHGWTLDVLICYKHGDEHRLLDQCSQTKFSRPINLNNWMKISDSSLLRPPPDLPTPPVFDERLLPHSRFRFPAPEVQTAPPLGAYHSTSTVPISQLEAAQRRQPGYAIAPTPASPNSIVPPAQYNITVQIRDWQELGNALPYHMTPPTSPNTHPIHHHHPSPLFHNNLHGTHLPQPVHPFPVLSGLSPTAASYNSMPATAPIPGSLPASRPGPNRPPYHTNPNGTPINTAHGATEIPPSSSVIVRNLPHRTTSDDVRIWFESHRCRVRRSEVSEGMGSNRRKIIAEVAFERPEDALRARSEGSGRRWNGRIIDVEIMKDDGGKVTEVGEGSRTMEAQDVARKDTREEDEQTEGEKRGSSSGPIIANGSEGDFSEGGSG